MSVGTDLELDWELLTIEMEAPCCESPHHEDESSHSEGPATHYMLINHCCYGPIGKVIPVCAKYAEHWSRMEKVSYCFWCKTALDPIQLNKVLGPINP